MPSSITRARAHSCCHQSRALSCANTNTPTQSHANVDARHANTRARAHTHTHVRLANTLENTICWREPIAAHRPPSYHAHAQAITICKDAPRTSSVRTFTLNARARPNTASALMPLITRTHDTQNTTHTHARTHACTHTHMHKNSDMKLRARRCSSRLDLHYTAAECCTVTPPMPGAGTYDC